MHPGK